MEDKSYLDRKYFIYPYVYNCPFCNRNNVSYSITSREDFNWTTTKPCYLYIVKCSSCDHYSMHLSFEEISDYGHGGRTWPISMKVGIDLDAKIFYSVPTSFFVLDSRVPAVVRELITEAEGCLKMNFLTGASACMRKAIYELLFFEKIEGGHYEDRIKLLKTKYTNSDPELFDILGHIQDMTSDKIHEQSWDKWDSKYLHLIIETLKTVLYDIYVLPNQKKQRSIQINELRKIVTENKKLK